VIMSARRWALTPTPGVFFGQEVAIRQVTVPWARATCGAASPAAPAASAPMTPRRATIDRPASLSLVMAFLVPCGLCRDRWRTLEHHRRQMKPAFHTAAGAAGRRGRRFVKGTIELFTTFQVRC